MISLCEPVYGKRNKENYSLSVTPLVNDRMRICTFQFDSFVDLVGGEGYTHVILYSTNLHHTKSLSGGVLFVYLTQQSSPFRLCVTVSHCSNLLEFADYSPLQP